MMDQPLLISSIALRAEEVFGDREIISRHTNGVDRIDYSILMTRVRRLATVLLELGVRPGDRVASFAWNSARHLELYLAVPSIGAVLHTVNIRLHADEIEFILRDAGSRVVFVDASIAASLPGVCDVEVLMPDATAERPAALDYESLMADAEESVEFPGIDERSAAVLCYTSGTTGRPKGVAYSHRSIVLYALMANQPDALGITENDVVMPVVPMFHANAWGLPYVATLAGAKQVLPGPSPTPADLAQLVASEQVTVSAAVPTVWQGLAQLVEQGQRPDLRSLREVIAGGAAVPESLIRTFDSLGVPMTQGWGMTETSPLALISRPSLRVDLTEDERYALRAKQGRPIALVRARVDPHDGELQVSGPTVTASYFQRDDISPLTADGWLRTGDVATVDDAGFIGLTDRTKDLIKSGGEWISSVELETAMLFHASVAEAAAVAMPDDKWGERPCMFIVTKDSCDLSLREVREFLAERFPRWALPDRVEIVDEIEKTSVGKIDKRSLRASLGNARLDGPSPARHDRPPA